jgi:hypothetical protein
MSDDFRIPTKNELREAIDKASDKLVAELRARLAAAEYERDRPGPRACRTAGDPTQRAGRETTTTNSVNGSKRVETGRNGSTSSSSSS